MMQCAIELGLGDSVVVATWATSARLKLTQSIVIVVQLKNQGNISSKSSITKTSKAVKLNIARVKAFLKMFK